MGWDNGVVTFSKRICPICEAGCGLLIRHSGRQIESARGNPDDTFSGGHVCPKGTALAALDADPDRLRTPLIRSGGRLRPASWPAAFDVIGAQLGAIRARHGDDAVAVYLGNPSAHNIGLGTGFGVLARTLGTRNIVTAGSVDQLPKQLACLLMYGNDMAVAVPDIARTDCLLMLGANPVVSNGSLWMVPDIRGKLRALRARGGRFIVVDPRRTETATLADLHLPIRPAGDAWLLIALLNRVWQAGRTPPASIAAQGLEALRAACAPVTLADAASGSGLPAESIVALADQLLAARRPAVYGRVGTTLQRFGTLTSFLIDALNLALGSLDAPGGAMFPEQPFASPARTPGPLPYGRYRSRVSGYPELLGQLPAACLAEEMEQPGPGQIRALISVAGNPVASNPDSARLARAIDGLEFRLAIDIYLTETSARADVVLPGTSPFEDGHYDSFLGGMSWRNTARYSPPLFPVQDRPDEWRLMLGVAYAARAGRCASDAELDAFEEETVAGLAEAWRHAPGSPIADRDLPAIMAAIGPRRGVERILDLGIRAGRWGDHFGRRAFRVEPGVEPSGLTLARLIEHPDSIDLGPLEPGLARVVGHPDGHLDCAPALILGEIARLRAALGAATDAGGHADDPDVLLLIGRRNVQTNNSWLHNLPALARGPNRCVLEMHPLDAARRALVDGEPVTVTTAVDAVTVPLRITEDLRPGVVCLPHGFSAGDWAHLSGVPDRAGPENEAFGQVHATARARQAGSANANALAAAGDVDLPSATAALNGIRVRCARAASSADTVLSATAPTIPSEAGEVLGS